MKKLIYIPAVIIIAYVIYSFARPAVDFNKDLPDGIQFYKGTLDEALKTAKTENKIIFIDIYASWCANCRKLKTTTFSEKSVGSFYNTKFLNIALDGEKGDGEMLVKKFAIEAYPALLFINGDGKLIKQVYGYQSSQEMVDLGRSIFQ